MTNTDREAAVDAVDTLNDLIGDLVAGTRVLSDYIQGHKANQVAPQQMVAVQKMCLSHLVLGLNKISEFWERYHQCVPPAFRAEVKSLNRDLKAKQVSELRNGVVAHVWDRKLQRARRHSEIMAQLDVMIGGDMGDFLRWINNPNDNAYPKTVLSVVEGVRDAIAEQHAITPGEIVDR